MDSLSGAALTAASLVLSVGLSFAVFKLIEQRAVAYGHRHVYVAGGAQLGAMPSKT